MKVKYILRLFLVCGMLATHNSSLFALFKTYTDCLKQTSSQAQQKQTTQAIRMLENLKEVFDLVDDTSKEKKTAIPEFFNIHLCRQAITTLKPTSCLGQLALFDLLEHPVQSAHDQDFGQRIMLIKALAQEPKLCELLQTQFKIIDAHVKKIFKCNLDDVEFEVTKDNPIQCSQKPRLPFAKEWSAKSLKYFALCLLFGFGIWTYAELFLASGATMSVTQMLSHAGAALGTGYCTTRWPFLSAISSWLIGFGRFDFLPASLKGWVGSFFTPPSSLMPTQVDGRFILPAFSLAMAWNGFTGILGRHQTDKERMAKEITESFMVIHNAVKECQRLCKDKPVLSAFATTLTNHNVGSVKKPEDMLKQVGSTLKNMGMLDVCTILAQDVSNKDATTVNLFECKNAVEYRRSIKKSLAFLWRINRYPIKLRAIEDKSKGRFIIDLNVLSQQGMQPAHVHPRLIKLYIDLLYAQTIGIIHGIGFPDPTKSMPLTFIDMYKVGACDSCERIKNVDGEIKSACLRAFWVPIS